MRTTVDTAILPLFGERERRLTRKERAERERARDQKDERIRREVENVEESVRALRATIDAEAISPKESGTPDASLSDAD